MKFTPRSRAVSMALSDSGSFMGPKCPAWTIVPRPTALTRNPVLPSILYFMGLNIGQLDPGPQVPTKKRRCQDDRELLLEVNRWLSELDSAVTVHYNAWAVTPRDTRELEQERFASEI